METEEEFVRSGVALAVVQSVEIGWVVAAVAPALYSILIGALELLGWRPS